MGNPFEKPPQEGVNPEEEMKQAKAESKGYRIPLTNPDASFEELKTERDRLQQVLEAENEREAYSHDPSIHPELTQELIDKYDKLIADREKGGEGKEKGQ